MFVLPDIMTWGFLSTCCVFCVDGNNRGVIIGDILAVLRYVLCDRR